MLKLLTFKVYNNKIYYMLNYYSKDFQLEMDAHHL